MGKYMRKAKTTGDAVKTLMEVGVRTRAKTLALQRLQSSSSSSPKPDTCYLQLRSRRLEKPPQLQNSRKAPQQKQSETEKTNSGSGFAIGPSNGCFEIGDSEIGENNLDTELRGRSTRESTPCSLIRTTDDIATPGSSTKPRSSSIANQRAQNALLRNIPTPREMEDFFAHAEQSHQRLFIEKYNFDIMNDMPLPGRYEWVKVMP